jgi:hypothetical protein
MPDVRAVKKQFVEWIIGGAFAFVGTPVLAQPLAGGWTIQVSNAVSLAQPSTTVSVYAHFHPIFGLADLFAGGDFSVTAEDGQWSDPVAVLQQIPPATGGMVSGSSVLGALVGQVHFPTSIPGSYANPMLAWQGTWSTSAFKPRTIALRTHDSTAFYVNDFQGSPTKVPLSSVSHGVGVIRVYPVASHVRRRSRRCAHRRATQPHETRARPPGRRPMKPRTPAGRGVPGAGVADVAHATFPLAPAAPSRRAQRPVTTDPPLHAAAEVPVLRHIYLK